MLHFAATASHDTDSSSKETSVVVSLVPWVTMTGGIVDMLHVGDAEVRRVAGRRADVTRTLASRSPSVLLHAIRQDIRPPPLCPFRYVCFVLVLFFCFSQSRTACTKHSSSEAAIGAVQSPLSVPAADNFRNSMHMQHQEHAHRARTCPPAKLPEAAHLSARQENQQRPVGCP